MNPASLFTSNRERRLWLLALAVVVAIYATLGSVGTLARVLRERNMLEVSFIAGFAVAIVAIIGSAWARRSSRYELWAMLTVAVAWWMIPVRMGIGPEERTHIFEYGLLGALIHQALLERRTGGRRVWSPPALAVVVTSLLGWLDEGIQSLLPERVYDIRDVGVNALAALAAVLASLVIGWVRRRFSN